MTPARFRDCLSSLSWSGRGVADVLRVNERQVRRRASGDYEIPPSVAEWLDRLARFHEANPPPERGHAHPTGRDRT
jgi:hypothetical protein